MNRVDHSSWNFRASLQKKDNNYILYDVNTGQRKSNDKREATRVR